ncbi:ABC transporter substrate-binding protein [Nonomuraea dietziae]|uniref:ABC transporter substrate-binding protein n=1 Tax=Nonomuraea dietziae TaxID=65515 RepID=UPI0033EEC547
MSVSRRGFLGLLLAATACGAESRPTPTAAARNAWSFTDDRGRKIDLPARPTRVVAQVSAAATLWDFGVRPMAVFGPHRLESGAKDPEAGDIDITKVQAIGNAWDEFDVERYIALRPEVLIAGMYLKNELWYVPAKSSAAIEQVAPTIGIQQENKAGDELIRRYEQLAVALGGAAQAQARERFVAAEKALVKAVGPKVLFCAASPDQFWVCDPRRFPDLKYLLSKGLDIVVPDRPDGYFETLSWENADKYDADAIFLDARAQSMKASEVIAKPTWPKGAQVYPWRAEMRFSHQGYAALLEELAVNLAKVRLS